MDVPVVDAPLVFSPARPEDMPEVVRVLNAAWVPVGLRIGVTLQRAPWFPAFVTQPAFEEYVAEHGIRVFVGRVDGAAAACGGWSPDPGDPAGAWLNRLAVAPEFQRRGYGRALVECLEMQAAQAGRTTIRLGHVTSEEPLHEMYVRMGYRTVTVELSRKWAVDITYMEKQLGDAGPGGN